MVFMGRRDFFEQEKRKKMITTFAVAVGLALVACMSIFVMYSKILEDEAEENLLALTKNNENVVSNEDLEQTSYSQDKTVPENKSETQNSVQVELPNNSVIENKVQNITKSPEVKEPETSVIEEPKNVTEEQQPVKDENQTQKAEVVEEELKFQAPIAGDIMKDFAMDTLVYSETLDEWCTHSGIDIKADKASVVMASEKGKVESIKNDPRYGLTVIVEHVNGYKTVYANLLSTEFVVEGETIKQGQSLGTVGNTASFEVSDEPHLHFELLKNNEQQDPELYLKK